MQTLVYGGQAAFDGAVQTLEAHYARTDNAARTDNSLRMIHLSVRIRINKWIILRLLSVQIYTDNNTEHLVCYILERALNRSRMKWPPLFSVLIDKQTAVPTQRIAIQNQFYRWALRIPNLLAHTRFISENKQNKVSYVE